jgi:hypothetical protein
LKSATRHPRSRRSSGGYRGSRRKRSLWLDPGYSAIAQLRDRLAGMTGEPMRSSTLLAFAYRAGHG